MPLLYNNSSLQSETGVQQGDPLCPLLFSLTLWPVIEKARDAVPNLTQHTWYLDDGFVAGSGDQIRTKLDVLSNEGPKRGLYLRKDNCELWSMVDLPSVDGTLSGSTGCRSRITRICFFLPAETCSKGCVAFGKFFVIWMILNVLSAYFVIA